MKEVIQKYIVFNGPLDLLKIGQYAFLLGAMINVNNPTTMTSDDKFSYFMSIVLIFIYSALPFAILCVFMHYNSKTGGLESEQYQKKFTVLNRELRDNSVVVLACPILFFIRRYLLILLLIGNSTHYVLILFGTIQVFIVAYHGLVRPFKLYTNRIE